MRLGCRSRFVFPSAFLKYPLFKAIQNDSRLLSLFGITRNLLACGTGTSRVAHPSVEPFSWWHYPRRSCFVFRNASQNSPDIESAGICRVNHLAAVPRVAALVSRRILSHNVCSATLLRIKSGSAYQNESRRYWVFCTSKQVKKLLRGLIQGGKDRASRTYVPVCMMQHEWYYFGERHSNNGSVSRRPLNAQREFELTGDKLVDERDDKTIRMTGVKGALYIRGEVV